MCASNWWSKLGTALYFTGLVLILGSCTRPNIARNEGSPNAPIIFPTTVMTASNTAEAAQAEITPEMSFPTGTPQLTPTTKPISTSRPLATLVPTPVRLSGSLVYAATEQNIENGTASLAVASNIYNLSLDTGHSAQLTTGNDRNLQPVWSPDGDRVAFISDRDGNLELYLMNANGSELTRLTDSAGNEGHPTWSPDGTVIVFERTQEAPATGKTSHLFAVSLENGSVRQLTNSPDNDYHPSWSPDGRYIAFNRDVLHREGDLRSYEPYIYLLDMMDGTEIPLTQALFDQVPFATAAGWRQVWLLNPVWLPMADSTYLSLTQMPARCDEGGVIAVFEIDWNLSPPALTKLVEISGGSEGYTWGPAGAWIISPEYGNNNENAPSSQPDLNTRYIGVYPLQPESTPPISDPISQRVPCMGFDAIEWLTTTTAYESMPDWKP